MTAAIPPTSVPLPLAPPPQPPQPSEAQQQPADARQKQQPPQPSEAQQQPADVRQKPQQQQPSEAQQQPADARQKPQQQAAMQQPQPPAEIHYSAEGAQIASDTYTRASGEQLASGANQVLWKGYGRIMSSPGTTDDEKAIARYGDATSRVTLDLQEHNRIAFSVIKAVAFPVSGPIGAIIGKVVYDAASNVKLANSANQALWKGYDAVLDLPGATDTEKAIAKLGREVSHVTLDTTEHNRIAYPLMQAIRDGRSGAAGPAIASAADASASNTKLAKSANEVLWKTYDILIDSTHTTAAEKAVARIGRRSSHVTMDVTEHNRIAFPLVRAIATGLQGPVGNAMAKATYDAAQNVKFAETANHLFWGAYNELLATPGVAEAERALASLGDAISRHTMAHTEHNRVSYPLFKMMSAPVTTAVPRALAWAATASAQNAANPETSGIVLREGFTAVLARPDSTGIQKRFAQMGLDIDRKPELTAKDANTLRLAVMDAIQKSPDLQAAAGQDGVVRIDPAALRAQARAFEESIAASQKEIAELDRRNADAQPLLDKAVDSYNKVAKKFNQAARVNRLLWMGGIAGGLAALSLSQPLFLIPLGAAGLSRLYLGSVDKKLATRHWEMEGIRTEMSRRTLESSLLRSKAELDRMQLEIIKPQVETLDMADALTKPKPSSAREIRESDDNAYVIIGGLRIAKRKFPGETEPIGADHPSGTPGPAKNTE